MQELVKLYHGTGTAYPRVMRRGVDIAHLQWEPNIFIDIHVGVEAVRLEYHGNIPVLWLKIIDDAAINLDVATGDLLKPGNHPHCGGLATSRWA